MIVFSAIKTLSTSVLHSKFSKSKKGSHGTEDGESSKSWAVGKNLVFLKQSAHDALEEAREGGGPINAADLDKNGA